MKDTDRCKLIIYDYSPVDKLEIILGGTSADASGDNFEHTLNISTSVINLQIVKPGLV